MMDVGFLLRFFDRTFMLKLFLLALLYSLVPLLEIWVLLFLGGLVGNYLTLAVTAATGLFGILLAARNFLAGLQRLKDKIRQGLHPADEFMHLIGILIGGILLLTPGFVTDLAGFLLLLPSVRDAIGHWVVRKARINLKEVYEYLRLYEL